MNKINTRNRWIFRLLCLCLLIPTLAWAANEAEYKKLSKSYTLHADNSQEFRYVMELTLLTHTAMNSTYGETFIVYPWEILGMKFNITLQECISGKIGRCAVPMFYMISGFLFFQNIDQGIKSIYVKMRKRIKTLLIPYVISCIFFLFSYIIIEIIPGMNKFVIADNMLALFDKPLSVILSSVFYKIPDKTYPLAFHLWFLRDLIIIVIVSPILYLVRSFLNKYILIMVLFFLNLSFGLNAYFPLQALFWFLLGDVVINNMNRIYSKYTLWIFIIISIIELYYDIRLPKYILLPVIFLGISSIWGIYDRLIPENFNINNYKYLNIACNSTFFIYLFHEPTINIIRKLLIIILGHTPFGFASSYILSPWIMAFILIFISATMKNYIPKIYSILVGGR